MALLAQKWDRCDQQRQLIRAVREMTIQAILAHRGVLEQEGSALLRMALIAGFVD
jgi:hypothetical protein